MCMIIGVPEVFDRDRRVFLGRRQARVTEQFLNLAKVSAHVEQMGGVTMPKSMRMDMLIQIRTDRALTEDPSSLASRKPTRPAFTT